MPQTVSDVMGQVKVRLSPDATLRTLATELSAARTGLAIVDVDDGGVISERDVLRAIAAGVDLDTARVGEHMTPHPVSVPATTPLSEACDLMISRSVRHLLVADGARLVGVLNMRDVVGVLSGAAALGAVPPAREA
jgi:CBS domain-containing protein